MILPKKKFQKRGVQPKRHAVVPRRSLPKPKIWLNISIALVAVILLTLTFYASQRKVIVGKAGTSGGNEICNNGIDDDSDTGIDRDDPDCDLELTVCKLTDWKAGAKYTLTRDLWPEDVPSDPGTCLNLSARDIFLDCNGHTIAGEKHASQPGIRVGQSTTVQNCRVTEFGYGIEIVSNGNGNILQDNILIRNKKGIYLRGNSDSNTIQRNSFRNNENHGIFISAGSTSNIIRDNTGCDNPDLDLWLQCSDTNPCTGTTGNNNIFTRVTATDGSASDTWPTLGTHYNLCPPDTDNDGFKDSNDNCPLNANGGAVGGLQVNPPSAGEDDSNTYVVEGKSYAVTLRKLNHTDAVFEVNVQNTGGMKEEEIKILNDFSKFKVTDIEYNTEDSGEVKNVDFVVGAQQDNDTDGLGNVCDNCPNTANANQADGNGDGIGDVCDPPVCGNNFVEGTEQCDDGNTVDTDNCKNDCRNNVCRDGVINTGVEQCDDGNNVNGDGCSGSCIITQQCNDGVNNYDSDTAIDCADPGCRIDEKMSGACIPTDNIELHTPICGNGFMEHPEQCDDGNDVNTDSCNNDCIIVTQCNDNVDNDNDGLKDFSSDPSVTTDDPGCSSGSDPLETGSSSLVCDNGGDSFNDRDTLADYRLTGGDPGCTSPTDSSEIDGICDDKIDDASDSDGLGDAPSGSNPADPGCSSFSDTTEIDGQCDDKANNDGDVSSSGQPLIDFNGINNDGINKDSGCSSFSDDDETAPPAPPPSGAPPPPSTPSPPSQCNDGSDNDADGVSDYPNDKSCSSASDNDETVPQQCSDSVDNDADGVTDHPNDKSCSSTTDNDETLPQQCSDGVDNDGDTLTDYLLDPGCSSTLDNDEVDATSLCVPPPSGISYWWPGDGNANDIIGGKNGILKNGATFTTLADGKVGQAFNFDGVNDYIDAGDFAGTFIADPTGQDLSVSFWVKPMGAKGGFRYIIDSTSDGSYKGIYCNLDGGTTVGSLKCIVHQSSKRFVVASGVGVITFNDWNLITLILDDVSGTLKLYKNGNLVSTSSGAPGVFSAGSTKLFIGATIDGFYSFSGSIDEVSFWNRVLTLEEIQQIYNAGSAGMCKSQCTPTTCAQLGATCGTPSNGCSVTLNCGTCSNGQICQNNQCVSSSTTCDDTHPSLCTTQTACTSNNNFWYNEVCDNACPTGTEDPNNDKVCTTIIIPPAQSCTQNNECSSGNCIDEKCTSDALTALLIRIKEIIENAQYSLIQTISGIAHAMQLYLNNELNLCSASVTLDCVPLGDECVENDDCSDTETCIGGYCTDAETSAVLLPIRDILTEQETESLSGISALTEIASNLEDEYNDEETTTGPSPGARIDTFEFTDIGDCREWTRNYQPPAVSSESSAWGVTVDNIGNVYVTNDGYDEETSIWTRKFSNDGTEELWDLEVNDPKANEDEVWSWDVITDSSGNVYALGETLGEDGDVVLQKINPDGTQNSVRYWGGNSESSMGSDYPLDVVLDNDDNIYVTGMSDNHMFVQKWAAGLDSPTPLWTKVENSFSVGEGIALADDGTLFVAGTIQHESSDNNDTAIWKIDADGTVSDPFIYNNDGEDYGYSIALDSDGKLYVGGSLDATGGGIEDTFYDATLFLWKVDWSSGEPSTVEENTYSHLEDGEGAFDVALYADNIYVLSGDLNGDRSIVLKVDKNSQNVVSRQEYVPAGRKASPTRMALDSQGHVFVVGQTYSDSYDTIFSIASFVKKYCQI